MYYYQLRTFNAFERFLHPVTKFETLSKNLTKTTVAEGKEMKGNEKRKKQFYAY